MIWLCLLSIPNRYIIFSEKINEKKLLKEISDSLHILKDPDFKPEPYKEESEVNSQKGDNEDDAEAEQKSGKSRSSRKSDNSDNKKSAKQDSDGSEFPCLMQYR